MSAPALEPTFGIEEEFFLIDPHTRDLVAAAPPGFLEECRRRLGDRVQEEMQAPQIELATPVLRNAAAARVSLPSLRNGLHAVASDFGMRLVAAGTHPLAPWREQAHSPKERYQRLIEDFQIVGRRNLVCGLHVHVAVPAGIDRIQLLNRLRPWLPLFLGVSASSPFWNGQRTGLMSYRQVAYDEWPRSGIPDAFADEADYAAFIDLLARCDALADGSFMWWAIRPSVRFPTLELRITDSCTRVRDSLAIAAAFRCLVRAHLRQPELGLACSTRTRLVVDENRWQVNRHGTAAILVDETSDGPIGFTQALERLRRIIAEDAAAMRCEAEIEHFATIVDSGTSAQAQLAIYARERECGRGRDESLRAVVDWLADATAGGPASARRRGTDIAAGYDEGPTVNA